MDLQTPSDSSRDWTVFVERVGMLLFFCGMWTTRFIAVPGFLLMMLGLCANFSQVKNKLLSSTVCMLAILWVAYNVVSAFIFAAIYPEYWYEQLNQGLRFVYLSGFVFLALGFNRHPDLIWPAIFLSFAGFFLTRLVYILLLFMEGQSITQSRPDLGLYTAIPMGQYSFFALMALVLFLSRSLGQRRRVLRFGIWAMFFAFSCFLILISKSRSTWLLLPFFLPSLLLAMVLIKKLSWARFGLIASVLSLTGILIFQGYSDQIVNRLETESETLDQIFAGDLRNIAAATESGRVKSIGVRVAMIRYGLNEWSENPIFGLGPGATKMLLDCCSPEEFKHLNDLHSFVPEVLLRTGLVGFALLLAINILIFRQVLSAYHSGRLPGELMLFIMFGLALHWAVALGNFRMVNYDWRVYWFMLAGLAAAYSFDPKIHKKQTPAAARKLESAQSEDSLVFQPIDNGSNPGVDERQAISPQRDF